MRRRAALLLVLAAAAASAQDEKLTSGPGATLTENKCRICHELQHIRRAELSAGEWADNLRNMRERGAPMTDAEMAVIQKYLSTYYNRDKPAPPPSPDTLASAGAEDPVQQLLGASGCTGCHAADKRVVGPSFQEVAKKYGADAGAAARLAAKIRSGGAGAWGQVPMPPNPAVSQADALRLADWVLRQK